MAQQLRALATLLEDLEDSRESILSARMVATLYVTLVPGDLTPSDFHVHQACR